MLFWTKTYFPFLKVVLLKKRHICNIDTNWISPTWHDKKIKAEWRSKTSSVNLIVHGLVKISFFIFVYFMIPWHICWMKCNQAQQQTNIYYHIPQAVKLTLPNYANTLCSWTVNNLKMTDYPCGPIHSIHLKSPNYSWRKSIEHICSYSDTSNIIFQTDQEKPYNPSILPWNSTNCQFYPYSISTPSHEHTTHNKSQSHAYKYD